MRWVARPLFWLLIVLFILVPCCCALVLTFSPRLFDQGTQWFTLSYLRQTLTGATAVAMVNLAYTSNFPLATYQLYDSINNFPPNFALASGMGCLLVAAVAIPLALQARALRGRSYAVLSGRTRQAVRRQLSRAGAALAVAGAAVFYLIALGVPGFGAVSASLLADYGGSFSLTLANYQAVFHQAGQFGPLERSLAYGALTASVTVAGGFAAAWLLSQRRGSANRVGASRVLDFLLLAAIALPSVVFAAGYIFAYIASSLPTNARVLVGAVSQLQPSLKDAARTHGASEAAAWARGVLPVVSRPLMMAWLLTFCGVFLELPISQLLYAPGSPPASVAINDNLSTYHFGTGMAQSVLAVGIALAVVGAVLCGYRLAAPAGWRRIRTARHG
ncbi:MAG TPA: hypothetical protein VGH27_01750 [Streptosporangiaceae bacterium]